MGGAGPLTAAEGSGGGPGEAAEMDISGRGELGQGGGLGDVGGLLSKGGLGEGRRAPATRAARICTAGDGEAAGLPPVRAISSDGGAGVGCPQV
jgi:hypothetical protein